MHKGNYVGQAPPGQFKDLFRSGPTVKDGRELNHSQGWFSWAFPLMPALDSPPLSVVWKGQTSASWCWGSSCHASLKCSDQPVVIMCLVEACESLVARGGGRTRVAI